MVPNLCAVPPSPTGGDIIRRRIRPPYTLVRTLSLAIFDYDLMYVPNFVKEGTDACELASGRDTPAKTASR